MKMKTVSNFYQLISRSGISVEIETEREARESMAKFWPKDTRLYKVTRTDTYEKLPQPKGEK